MNNRILRIGLIWLILSSVDIFLVSRLEITVYLVLHIYMLSLLMLPVRTTKGTLLLFGFFSGLVMDVFLSTGGLHAAATTFMAFLRIFVLRTFVSPEDEENNISPGLYSLGFRSYLIYSAILVIGHHLVFFWLEIFKLSSILLILSKTFISAIANVFLMICIQLLFTRKGKKNERRKRQ